MTEKQHFVGGRSRDVPWYQADLDEVDPDARKVLETYSRVPSDDVLPHVLDIRDRAWEVFPYPCIGQFRFMEMAIARFPNYPEILQRLKSGQEEYLDLGCCFGQDMRRLVADGVPSETLTGSDVQAGFLDLGYDLFLDKDTLKSRFIQADVFDPESELKPLDGQIDIVHASSFFHLFGYEGQKKIAKRVVQLLKPHKGSLLVGRQVGNIEAQEEASKASGSGSMYQHNADSWKQLWEEVGNETGTRWDVDAELHEWPAVASGQVKWHKDGTRRLMFAVKRL